VKGYKIREDMNGIAEPPGKTWFWELEAGVIDAGRCIECGTCVAVCPSNSIGVSEEGLPELVKMCTGCSLCWDFCPRGGMRYEALWPPSTPDEDAIDAPVVVRSDSADPYWKITGGPPGDGLGAVVERYAARAGKRPDGAQDGGVVSAILIAALAAGDIDGALVSRPSKDKEEPWKGVATIATTAAEITDSAGSFYNQTMALAELDLSSYDLPPKPRLAVVGTPCEIQGIRGMQARRWPGGTGAHRVDAVTLTIALLCTKSFDYEALMLRELRDKRGLDLDRVSKVDVIHGRMIVEYRDGKVAVDEPIKDFHGAALKGCDECADFLGRGADISIGSVGSMTGWSSVLIRTETGHLALDRARGRLDLRDLDNPEALIKLDQLDKRIAVRSLQRKLDPDAPLFIDYAEHLNAYRDTDRAPVVRDR
jgi:coenzyme F420 hydrogenase subunit beta